MDNWVPWAMALFATLIGTGFGTFLSYSKERVNFDRANAATKKALQFALVAELYLNQSAVIGAIRSFHTGLDDGAEHIPAQDYSVQSTALQSMQHHIGILDPMVAAQIMYVYRRLSEAAQQHKLVAGYQRPLGSEDFGGEGMGGYMTNRIMLHGLLGELDEDINSLIPKLNGGQPAGEYSVEWDIRTALQEKRAAGLS